MPDINQNLGILSQLPSPTDYIAGAVSGIDYRIMNPTGIWPTPIGESQIGKYGDTYGCVTFSALNCIESTLLYNGINSNFSDRFTAKMSGTTQYGNYVQKVADSIRHDGLVNESDWSWNPLGDNPRFTWEEFYKDIPEDIQQRGQLFLQQYEVKYEWIPTDIESLKTHLKQAPLQIVIKICPYWNTGTVKGCGIASEHAVMLYNIDEDGYHIFDHYNPYPKVLALDYGIACAFKYVISNRINKLMLTKYKGKLVRNAITGAFGLCLGDQILDANSSDRTALMALDNQLRSGFGVTITSQEWDSVSHRPF